MRPTITKTYEMPVPSGVSLSYKVGGNGFTVTNGIISVFIPGYCVEGFREALYVIHTEMELAKAKRDGIDR